MSTTSRVPSIVPSTAGTAATSQVEASGLPTSPGSPKTMNKTARAPHKQRRASTVPSCESDCSEADNDTQSKSLWNTFTSGVKSGWNDLQSKVKNTLAAWTANDKDEVRPYLNFLEATAIQAGGETTKARTKRLFDPLYGVSHWDRGSWDSDTKRTFDRMATDMETLAEDLEHERQGEPPRTSNAIGAMTKYLDRWSYYGGDHFTVPIARKEADKCLDEIPTFLKDEMKEVERSRQEPTFTASSVLLPMSVLAIGAACLASQDR